MLNTPWKRFGAIVSLAGVAMFAFAEWRWGRSTSFESCVQHYSAINGCRPYRWGLGLLLLGVALPGVVAWVRHGRPAKNR